MAAVPVLAPDGPRRRDSVEGRAANSPPMATLRSCSPTLLAMVERDRPDLRAGETGLCRTCRARRPGEMWNWRTTARSALEYLFWSGQITAARRVNFERHYDVPDRVIAPSVLGSAASRRRRRRPARAGPQSRRDALCAVATEPDLRDYFRLPHEDSKDRVAELVESGELAPVRLVRRLECARSLPVAGWRGALRRITARALLSPFDPLVWFRDRTERIFGFRYRIEIYTPAAQRQYGYYVLPFLLDEQLVARVDLKSDRQAGVLRVQGSFLEDGHDPYYVAAELAAELAITGVLAGLGWCRGDAQRRSGAGARRRGSVAGATLRAVRLAARTRFRRAGCCPSRCVPAR